MPTFNYATDHARGGEDVGYPIAYLTISDQDIADDLQSDVLYDGKISRSPTIRKPELQTRYGISGLDSLSLEISNVDGEFNAIDPVGFNARLWFADKDANVYKTYDGKITNFTLGNQCLITVQSEVVNTLNKQLPPRTVREALSLTSQTHLGNTSDAVNLVFGRAIKVPCYPASQSGDVFQYCFSEKASSTDTLLPVTTVYADEVALSRFEATGMPTNTTNSDGDTYTASVELDVQFRRAKGFYNGWFVMNRDSRDHVMLVTDYDGINLTLHHIKGLWRQTNGEVFILSEHDLGRTFYLTNNTCVLALGKRFGSQGSLNKIYANVDNGLRGFLNILRRIIQDRTWGLGLTLDPVSYNAAVPLLSSLFLEGAIIHPTSVIQLLEEILSYRDIILTSGKNGIEIKVPSPSSPVLTLGYQDEKGIDNIARPPRIDYLPMGERIGGVKVRYRKDHSQNDVYQQELRLPVPGGGTAPDLEIDLRFVHGHGTAARILDWRVKRIAAANRRMTLEVGMEAVNVNVGDVVSTDIPSLGESGEWEVVATDHQIAGTQRLTLVPYSEDAFTYTPIPLPAEERYDIPPDFEHTPPLSVANLQANVDVRANGLSVQAYMDITWSPPSNNYGGAVVEIKRTTESEWREVGIFDGSSVRITEGVLPRVGYDVRVHSLNINKELRGLSVTTQNRIIVKTVSRPANLTGSGQYGSLVWQWDNSTSSDISYHEVEVYPNPRGTGDPVARQKFLLDDHPAYELTITADLSTTTTRYARVRAVDIEGYQSGWTAFVPASTTRVEADDLSQGTIITLTGLNQISNLNSLAGGTVFLYSAGSVGAPSGNEGSVTTDEGRVRQFATDFNTGSDYTRTRPNATSAWRAWEFLLLIGAGAVGSREIADDAVTSSKINDGAVGRNKIGSRAVTNSKIQDSAVTGSKVGSGAITDGKIASGAVTNSKIQDSAVTGSKVGSGAITDGKIASGAVTNSKIRDSAVTGSKVGSGAITDGKIASGAVTGSKIRDSAVTGSKVGSGAISDAKIADNAVTSSKIRDDAVTGSKVGSGAISDAKIADNAVTSSKIRDDAVSRRNIASSAISATEIAGNAITTPKIAANAVTTTQLAANSVIANKIAAGAITAGKIEAGAVTAEKIEAGAITAEKIRSRSIITEKINPGAVTSAVRSALRVFSLTFTVTVTGTLTGQAYTVSGIGNFTPVLSFNISTFGKNPLGYAEAEVISNPNTSTITINDVRIVERDASRVRVSVDYTVVQNFQRVGIFRGFYRSRIYIW